MHFLFQIENLPYLKLLLLSRYEKHPLQIPSKYDLVSRISYKILQSLFIYILLHHSFWFLTSNKRHILIALEKTSKQMKELTLLLPTSANEKSRFEFCFRKNVINVILMIIGN